MNSTDQITLVAVNAAGLVKALQGEGPFLSSRRPMEPSQSPAEREEVLRAIVLARVFKRHAIGEELRGTRAPFGARKTNRNRRRCCEHEDEMQSIRECV